MSTENKDFKLNTIIEEIGKGKCILFLGPYAYFDNNDILIQEKIDKELGITSLDNEYIHKYYEDGFFFFKNGKARNKYIKQLRSFYAKETEQRNHLLEKIAQIPFRIIITLTSDNLLVEAFKHLHLKFDHDFYYKNNPAPGELMPTRKKPLVYNMLGSLNQYDSMVLSHDDLFDYLKSIFAEKSMNQNLKQELIGAEQYIFLGLPFEKWYMQLLLRVLMLHTETLEHLDLLATKPIDEIKENIYVDQFDIEFILDDTKQLIDELYNRCKEKGIIRNLPQKQEDIKLKSTKEIKELIAKAKTEEAINEMDRIIEIKYPNSNFQSDLLLIRNNYNSILEKEMIGLIDSEKSGIQKNQIIYRIFDLLNKI